MITADADLGIRFSAWMRERAALVDGVVAVALLAACLAWGVLVRAGAGYAVLAVLLLAPLAVRRRWPAACLVTVAGVALVQWLDRPLGHRGAFPADIAVPIAVHAAAAYGPAWASRLGLGAGLAGSVLGGSAGRSCVPTAGPHVLVGAFLASTVVAAWTVGSCAASA